jgi:hypothetical protein
VLICTRLCVGLFPCVVGTFPLFSESNLHVSLQSLKCCILGSHLPLGARGQSLVGFHFYFCQLTVQHPSQRSDYFKLMPFKELVV